MPLRVGASALAARHDGILALAVLREYLSTRVILFAHGGALFKRDRINAASRRRPRERMTRSIQDLDFLRSVAGKNFFVDY